MPDIPRYDLETMKAQLKHLRTEKHDAWDVLSTIYMEFAMLDKQEHMTPHAQALVDSLLDDISRLLNDQILGVDSDE